MKKVAIIDYGLCNLFSVVSACKKVGLEPLVSDNHEEILQADAAILPGVGAFGAAMTCIKERALDKTIKEFIQTGKPFMGICLGLQLLFESSEEFGENSGLGIVKGSVKRIPAEIGKVPQINWNQISISEQRKDSKILKDVKNDGYMYFVHSYYVDPADKSDILTFTTYGKLKYCSSIQKDNLYAFQFHPEKSAMEGIKVYENFKNLVEQGA